MRVSISPRGSFKFIRASFPARLDHAWDLALRSQIPERDAGNLELAIEAARAARQLATIAIPRRRGIARHRCKLDAGPEALLGRQAFVQRDRLQFPAPRRMLLRQPLPLFVALN
jgi:hypothetical protein